MAENRRAYVLVNNRSEGNAPLTVQGLSEMLRDYILSSVTLCGLPARMTVGMVNTTQRPGSFRSRALTSYRGGCHPVTRSEASSLYYAPGPVHMSKNPSIVQEEPGSSDRIGSHQAV